MSGPHPAAVGGWISSPILINRNPRLQSVDRALQHVVASLEKEQTLKKVSLHASSQPGALADASQTLREAMEPIEDVARRATSILNDLHSAYNIDRELPVTDPPSNGQAEVFLRQCGID